MTELRTTRKPTQAPKRTLASVVTRRLRERIIGGDIPPGTQMNEAELAAAFATSRGPIREGMQRLVQEGLLISAPHRGVFVPILTVADLEDLYFARGALERAAVHRAAERGLTAAQVRDIERTLEEMELAVEEDEPLRISAADLQFHEALVAAADSPRLSETFRTLAGHTRLGLNLLVGTEDCESLVSEHTAIYQAIVARDEDLATRLLEQHFADSRRTLVAKLAQATDLQATDLQPPDPQDSPEPGQEQT